MSDDLMAMFRSLQGSLLAHRPHLVSAPEVAPGSAVPVTLLTGFLGAGKSTLLTALLTNPPAGQLVKAVVNDVGQLPFDPTLVATAGDLEVELTNGCGCCGDAGDLGATLATLAQSKPDVLVLEASGIADPFALAQIVEADPGLCLDRIVAVADATSVEAQLADPTLAPILRRQVEAAHVVVVSHSELCAPEHRGHLTELLAAMAPGRTIVSSTRQDPTIDVLLPGSLRGAVLPVDSVPPGHQLITLTAEQTSSLTLVEINRVVSGLPSQVVRCKGVLRTPDATVLLQATQSGSEVSVVEPSGDEPSGRWHGVTLVGIDRVTVQRAAGSLGCEHDADLSWAGQTRP